MFFLFFPHNPPAGIIAEEGHVAQSSAFLLPLIVKNSKPTKTMKAIAPILLFKSGCSYLGMMSWKKKLEKVVYLDGGVIRAIGSFDEVRSAVPDFERQAKLLGL